MTLLNEAASWGSAGVRGVVANELADRFGLGSRRSAPAPFIASLRDPLSGRSVSYSLEPYLPTVGYTGFAAALPEPLFTLDKEDPGQVSVSVTTPSGEVLELAHEAPVQMFVSASWRSGYPVELSFAGPARTIGLTTLVDELDFEFTEYGFHEVVVDGALRSSRGDEFVIVGTFEIWIAEPLDLSLGVFEGTPLEIGDQWSPVVVVEPSVPANITVEIAHYVNGDPDDRQDHSLSGTANQFGYFAATPTWQPESHGEYRASIVASYLDPVDGTLWMGARSSASIVATPDTPLVAHGERNDALADLANDQTLRTWFFTRSFEPECGEVACDGEPSARGIGRYPFFRGDVAWLADASPITPSITVDGPEDILAQVAPQLEPNIYCFRSGCVESPDTHLLVSSTSAGRVVHQRVDAVSSWAYWYSSTIRADVSVFHAASEGSAEHNQWYGDDSYNCQIGLPCHGAFFPPLFIDKNGDEEGDVKLLFGGAVLKNDDQQYFLPYASMAVIVPEAIPNPDGTWLLRDDKGNRVCPPYQGAAGGLGTCGPLLIHDGRDVDLFVTPTGTRPGSVLQPGDRFVFSGQVWPTLDVAVEVSVTGPSGDVQQFESRANIVGYIDPADMTFIVEEPGVYEVHVSLAQDRPVPSTGVIPDPVLVADGQTTLDVYGYDDPLSAVIGSTDSTYHFYVVDTAAESTITSSTKTTPGPAGQFLVDAVTFFYQLPSGVTDAYYSLTAPGIVLRDETVPSPSETIEVELTQEEVDSRGFTNIILGADTLQLSIAYHTDSGWSALTLNQRGFSPLAGHPVPSG